MTPRAVFAVGTRVAWNSTSVVSRKLVRKDAGGRKAVQSLQLVQFVLFPPDDIFSDTGLDVEWKQPIFSGMKDSMIGLKYGRRLLLKLNTMGCDMGGVGRRHLDAS